MSDPESASDEKGTLDIVDRAGGGYSIAWMFEDFGRGLTLGEGNDPFDKKMAEPEDREEWEHWIAINVVRQTEPQHDRNGYWWESHSAAKKALAAIKARWKLGREMPEWAQKALAAGWKAPKGWKP